MSLPEFLRRRDTNDGVETCRATPGAVLLDVRDRSEYAEGHIAGSVNLPLGRLDSIDPFAPSPDTPLFVYCYSGRRSASAVAALREEGYTSVTNIGGIGQWDGPVEQGGTL